MGLLNQVWRLWEKPIDYKKLLENLEKNSDKSELDELLDLLELNYEELEFTEKLKFLEQIKRMFDEWKNFFEIKNELLDGTPSVKKVFIEEAKTFFELREELREQLSKELWGDTTSVKKVKNLWVESGLDMWSSGTAADRAWF